MNQHNDITKPFWIVPIKKHYGELKEGNVVHSKEEFETFSSKEDWELRLAELGIELPDEKVENI